MSAILKQIEQEIDLCIDTTVENSIQHIRQCYDLLFPYIQVSYDNSRGAIQFCINQFQRITYHSLVAQWIIAMENLRDICYLFQSEPTSSINYIRTNWNDIDLKPLIDKSLGSLPTQSNISTLYPQVAQVLSNEERRKIASFIIDSVQHYGLKTNWDKDTVENHTIYSCILYSICKEDNVMDLFFRYYYNILDRMIHSGEPQMARDFAETLLVIGYNEKLLAESYFGACRTYTLANNPIAGLLYINFTLKSLAQKGEKISQQFAFEILWQFLKIMRGLRLVLKDDLIFLHNEFNKLSCNDYDRLSFSHTIFSIKLSSKDSTLPDEVADFLNENREIFFQNIEHSAMPWISLISGLRERFSEFNYSSIELYEKALKQVVEKDGNETYLDLLENENLACHLKEVLVKLRSTRERDDYSRDNQLALVLAKKLISQAVDEENPSDFILAMQPKSDFTFILPENTQTQMFKQLKVEDVNGADYNLYYCEVEILKHLIQADDSDAIIWIGKGSESVFFMILLRDMYTFNTLPNWININLKLIQNDIISQLKYCRENKRNGEPIYVKSINELEHENESLLQSLKECCMPIPNVVTRFLFVKDLEVATYPHQLIIDSRENRFIGEMLPTANVISTELLIKTNFEDQLPNKFSKSLWLPVDSGEFTFSVILGQLEEEITKYNINVHCEKTPATPLHDDLNIICAHGGKNISETEWFYANEEPLIETKHIIGVGKMLVLLVCHSGSISHTVYDNAMHTIVKRYIQMGYSSIVAPMWSLPTTIISTWLSIFLEHMENGAYIIDAVYKANMHVKGKFFSASAWACLHLFGNPYLQVKDRPRLTFEVN